MTRLITTWVFVTAFLFANIAAAGLPPTSTKSQLDTSKSTTFDFQAPFNQFTKPNGTTALIETGNKNLLKDPGFESSDPTAVWVIALAGTVSRTSTAANVGSGSYALSYDAAATNGTVTSAAVAVPNGFIGKTLEASCDIKNTSAGLYKIQAYDGTNVLAEQLITKDSTYYVRNTLNFPAPTSGSISIRFLSGTAGEPIFYVDDCYLGLARNVGSTQLISEPTSYTPTIGLTGGTTSASAKWQRIGPDIEVWGDATFTTVFTGGTATVGLPSVCTIDTTKMPVTPASGVGYIGAGYLYDVGSGQYAATITYNDTTSVMMRTLQDDVGASGDYIFADRNVTTLLPFTWANNDRISFRFKVPCVGWTAQTTASIDAISKRGSISFSTGSATITGALATFNVAGFGTNTLEGQALAPTTANDLGIRMTGAPAGVYEVTAVGKFYASSPATTGTRTVCEFRLYDGTNHSAGAYGIATGGGTYETNDSIANITGLFTLSSAGTINVVVRGQRVAGNGTCYAEAGAYISIKNVSQPSPAIVLANSVTTGTINGERIERATVASGCASVTSSSGTWVSSVSKPSTGQCTVNIASGSFSSAPTCVCTVNVERTCRMTAVPTTASFTVDIFNGGSPPIASDSSINVICMGPR